MSRYFLTGFKYVCDGLDLKLFTAKELEQLICGSPELDFAELEQYCMYQVGCSSGMKARRRESRQGEGKVKDTR